MSEGEGVQYTGGMSLVHWDDTMSTLGVYSMLEG